MKHANGQPLPIPDCIVEQIRDEATEDGNTALAQACERVLAHSWISADDAEIEQYDRDLEHCWRVLDAQGAR